MVRGLSHSIGPCRDMLVVVVSQRQESSPSSHHMVAAGPPLVGQDLNAKPYMLTSPQFYTTIIIQNLRIPDNFLFYIVNLNIF
jgi:hypothetical protein